MCRRCVGAAVPGCLALLRRNTRPALAPLPQDAGVALIARMAKVHVQALDYKGRLACYELLHEALRVRGVVRGGGARVSLSCGRHGCCCAQWQGHA
jgi:hypothetical protein